MKMPEEDVQLFLKLYWSLLFYANQRKPTLPGLSGPDFKDQELKKRFSLNRWCFSHPETIDSYIAENPDGFNAGELAIIERWKNHVTGSFIIVAHQTNYLVFLSLEPDPKAFDVIPLTDRIKDMADPYLPTMVRATLLPFKGRIIHSGILGKGRFRFRSLMKGSVNWRYREARGRFGIIDSLDIPFSEQMKSDENRLRFYAWNEDDRIECADEVGALLGKNPSLRPFYSREIARSNAKSVCKRLSEMGTGWRWYGMFEDTIIASGRSRNEVKNRVEELLPGRIEYVYLFKHRGDRRVTNRGRAYG